MKQLFRFVVIAIAACTLNFLQLSADSPRMVIVEEATNASCGPCARQNPTFQAFLQQLEVKQVAIPIKYQAWFPGKDIMNAADSNFHNSRVRYYGFQNIGVPCAAVNGSILSKSSDSYYDGAPSDTTAISQAVEAIRGTTSPITITIEETRNGNTMNIQVVVGSSSALQSSQKLRVVIAERFHYYASAGTNGEKEFYNIGRKMLPNLNGEELTIAAGTSKTFNYTYTIPTTGQYALDPTMLYVVAFVQDEDTKEVLQARSNAKDDAVANVSIEQPFLLTIPRSSNLTKEVKIVNDGKTPTEVNVSIDKDAYPLPTGWTATVEPKTVTVPAGESVAVNVIVNSPAEAAYALVGIKAVTSYADKFNLAGLNAFGVLSENPKIITYSGYTTFGLTNYNSGLSASVKKDAVVIPFNPAIIQEYMDQIGGADVQIFPIGTNPVEYPNWVASPLPYINAAIENGKKIMLIAPRAMNYAFADIQGDANGNTVGAQDFFSNAGLAYSQTKVRFSGSTLSPFTVKGIAGDPIGNKLNNNATIQGNTAASINNTSYTLYTDVFTITDPTIAKPILYYDNVAGDLAGARMELNNTRMVFLTFGLESLGAATVANEILKRSVDWLLSGTAASVDETIAEGFNADLSMSISPNPLSEVGTITYTVKGLSSQFVTVSLVDGLGREVAQLASGQQMPGTYNVNFDASKISAGAYRVITRTMNGNGIQLPLMIVR
ncbi:hypothetical protein LBMAG36_02060 [Chlorobiota bacterium]|nr:hypothetical protein LBMAG36_02060 [Chlorobiota bacterium]